MTNTPARKTRIGFALSSEEHGPRRLVELAARAEGSGFDFLSISDHFHPWIDDQGHSPFVWSVLGAIAQATNEIPIGTGVTCPTIRTHPGIIAQAAATAACLLPGRFRLGLGSGEALNEHIFGDRWPSAPERLEMFAEAIDVIRLLWEGGSQSHRGRHYTVENARIYDLPDELPPIIIAGAGKKSATLAAEKGDGFWNTSPDPEPVEIFESNGGKGKPMWAQVTFCYHEDAAQARKIALKQWPNTAMPGQLSQDLPTPKHFEQAAQLVTEDDMAKAVPCGPDLDPIVKAVKEYREVGFDHIYLHQIGSDQDSFFKIWDAELRETLASL